jgi:hypothetical protein
MEWENVMTKVLHPGFKKSQQAIAKKQGVSQKTAGKILGAAARNASPAAKKKNPHIKRVNGA